jgi:hypothetical protein
MALPLTWDQMPLTPAQQTMMQQLSAYKGGAQPPLTYSQIKQARDWIISCNALVDPARSGMVEAYQWYQNKAASDFDAANP